MDRPSQVLRFILHYFDYLKDKEMNLVESLQFVFQLSFLSLGKSYPTSMLSEAKMELLKNMRELGLAYQRKITANRFYITRLALSLAFGSSAAGGGIRNAVTADAGVDPDLLMAMNRLPTGVSQRFVKSGDDGGDAPEVGFILVETNFRLYAYTG